MSLIQCTSEERCLVPLMQHEELVCRNHRDQRVPALSCSECAYVGFLPPHDSELTRYYSEQYAKGSSDWYNIEADYRDEKVNARADHVADLARRFFPGRTSLVMMEVGCAFGGTVAELRRRGFNSYGADLNCDAIRQGVKHGNEFIFSNSAQSVLLERGQRANVIYAYHALEHIPDVRSFLLDIQGCLADRAILQFMVPNGAYLKAWQSGFDSWNWFAYPDHLHMFSPRSALCLAETTGLELLQVKSSRCEESLDCIRRSLGWTDEVMPDCVLVSMLEQALLMDELTMTFCVAGSEIAFEYAPLIEETKQRCSHNAEIEKTLRSLKHVPFIPQPRVASC